MQNLQSAIANFELKDQEFCALLNMSWDCVDTLKETDSPEGNEFYAVYSAFHEGHWPSAEFLNKYRKAA